MVKYRHEIKHDITASDMITIRQRLKAVAEADAHAIDGKYLIRSLYFDTPGDILLLLSTECDALHTTFD